MSVLPAHISEVRLFVFHGVNACRLLRIKAMCAGGPFRSLQRLQQKQQQQPSLPSPCLCPLHHSLHTGPLFTVSFIPIQKFNSHAITWSILEGMSHIDVCLSVPLATSQFFYIPVTLLVTLFFLKYLTLREMAFFQPIASSFLSFFGATSEECQLYETL